MSDTPHVLQYLKRTGASGGGGRSLPVISKQLFKKLFSQLSRKGIGRLWSRHTDSDAGVEMEMEE